MPSETLWDREEPTIGKHLVLKYYLDGWFPILGSWNGRLLFIDGFAGLGEYADGKLGSPLIALDCVRQQREKGRLKDVKVVCLFIASDIERARHLQGILDSRRPLLGASCEVLHGPFKAQLKEHGAKQVVLFELWNGNRHIHDLFRIRKP